MTHIETRHDTAAGWTAANPVLNPGELGIETNTRKMKFGDGVTAWNSLLYIVSPITATKADVGLSNVDNTSDDAKPLSSAATAALALKAPLASPTFTGDPKAPTPATADNDTSIATTAYVNAVLAATTLFERYQNLPSGTTNLNSLTEAGSYSVPPGSTNGPAGFDNGYVAVVGTSSFTSQIAQSINGDRLWHRTRNAGAWSMWRELGGTVRCVAATTSNDTLSGLAARDGYTPAIGDLILVPYQTTQANNGIYVAASGTWSRWTGADTAAEIASLDTVRVMNGTWFGGSRWSTNFRLSDVVGTTAMIWSFVGGSDTGWQALNFSANWANLAGYAACQARRIGTSLYIRGTASRSSSTSGVGAVLATVPAGFGMTIPATQIWTGDTQGSHAQLSINTSGQILAFQAVTSGSSLTLTSPPLSLV